MPRIAPSIHASWGQLSDAELAAYEERAAAEEGMLGPPGCEYEKLFKVGPGTGGPGTGTRASAQVTDHWDWHPWLFGVELGALVLGAGPQTGHAAGRPAACSWHARLAAVQPSPPLPPPGLRWMQVYVEACDQMQEHDTRQHNGTTVGAPPPQRAALRCFDLGPRPPLGVQSRRGCCAGPPLLAEPQAGGDLPPGSTSFLGHRWP